MASIKNNCALVEQSFHSALLGDDNLKNHTLQPGDFVCWKRHLQKDSSTLLERSFSGTTNQPSCHQTPGNRLLDSRNMQRKHQTSLDLHSLWWPGIEAGDIWRDHFAKISRPGLLEGFRFTEVSLFHLDHWMTLGSYPSSWFPNFFIRLYPDNTFRSSLR